MSQFAHGIRLVYNDKHAVGDSVTFDPRNFSVFDLVTGEQLLNVYRVQIDVSRTEPTRLTLTIGAPFEYEGPIEFLTGTDV